MYKGKRKLERKKEEILWEKIEKKHIGLDWGEGLRDHMEARDHKSNKPSPRY
jgi:hypothetical protein